MKNEIWLPIKKYPGYAVSDCGRIKSMRRTLVLRNGKKHTVTEKFLTVKKGPSGNNYVIIPYQGKNYSELVEVLYYQSKKQSNSIPLQKELQHPLKQPCFDGPF